MRVTDRGTTLVVEDTPGCLWIFGAWFIVGGVIALLMPFVASNRDVVPGWGKVLAVLLGAASAVVGVVAIRRSPTTRAEFDAAANRVRVHIRTPFGQTRIEEASLADIGVVQVLPSRDGDGADWKTNPFAFVREVRDVRREEVLSLALGSGGGAAIRFTPKP